MFEDITARGLDIPVLVYFTDGEGSFPEAAPGYQVLWVLTGDVKVPFGASVRLDRER